MELFKPFWREQPFSEKEKELLGLLFQAHYQSVFRPNVSTEAVKGAALGSGDYTKSIAAALMTLGSLHAPVVQAVSLLSTDFPARIAHSILDAGQKIPGWGSSFHRGEIDPIWKPLEAWLAVNHAEMSAKLETVSLILEGRGKKIRPNPGAYTAATAIILGMPAKLAPWLFVQGRLAGWSELFLHV